MKLLLSIHKYDVFMFTWLLNAKIHSTLSNISRYLSKTGDGQLYVLIAAVLYFSEGLESPLLRAMLLAFLVERPLYFVLKNSFKRNRPEAALKNFRSIIKPSDKFSFPSGHTSAAFMVATLLAYFFPALLVPLYGWAAAVALSRVVLGVHFPTDTLMGGILGICTALFSLGQII
ncbi:phosphatase PAP2 family protein [Methylovulum psychrotolerans]|uniref:undecaprenyl-diphosphate phosphatase n=1 Tax=Methylovulum psychrotolerans TaxID=1704499 RepID=A0A1Z4C0T7_9GAMM|nr:phosphatase PAP2 family protein [Methylovulum psychrotolerans]ASF47130.1 phosphatase PAP2 family protein [Methylovulum psychrotolerans]MBT9098007.1 phosphatase PAP2 family protein [Methylovulum psychrotolerans]POZ53707.1 PAP2 family protein [Methylovulum psychrotolerans]